MARCCVSIEAAAHAAVRTRMTLPRVVRAETLDELAADDPAAQRSRRDLRRVHVAMGTRRMLLRALRELPALAASTAPEGRRAPLRVLELGAGDASLMLGVARALGPLWGAVEFTVLDRQALVAPATVAAYARLGWRVTVAVRDVFDWAAESRAPGSPRWDVIVANLFLHHFEGAALGAVLGAMAARAGHCVACEPRRSRLALVGSHLVGALGANAVTRGDAVLSVHAGFSGTELTRAWPRAGAAWRTQEYAAGLFSHCFVAERIEVP